MSVLDQADGTFPSTCWECSTVCGSFVTVKDGRVAKVGPNAAHPATQGAFCVKGILGAPGWTYHDARLSQPLRRAGARGEGKWQPITWDEALEEMADRLADVRARYGPLALAGAVSGAFFSRGLTIALLMRSLGSPNWLINQDLCGGCRALSDRITGLAIERGEDIEHTRCALVVGRNPSAADPAQWQALKRAKTRGARIIAIDPKRIPVVELADLWLRPRPGTDAALALAMTHVLISERRYDQAFVAQWTHGFEALAARAAQYPPDRASRLTGVASEDIVRAARMYADGPSSFVSGHGIDAFSAGVQTFRAYHCLVAISGNVDREGGNRRVKKPRGFRTYLDLLQHPDFRLPREVEERTIGAARFPLWAGPRGWQMACHNPSVIDAILTGQPYPVRAMYVSGVNIVVTYPNPRKTAEALRSLDFLAVATQHMNPTAELADLVLPKTTTLEEEEVSLNPGGPCLTFTRAAVAPRGEARCDLDIATALLDRLEVRGAVTQRFFQWRTPREFSDFLLAGTGVSLEELAAQGFVTFPYQVGNFGDQTFNTPTGRIELSSVTLEQLGLDPLPDFIERGGPDMAPTPPSVRHAPAEPGRASDSGSIGESPTARRESAYPLVLLTGDREKAYHHSRFREQEWARRISPDPELRVHPQTAATYGIASGDWVWVETAGGPGQCRLRVDVTDATPPDVVSTGMGWWRPDAAGPDRGAFDVNVNAAMSYDGPWDPVSGSADTRGLRCRIRRVTAPPGRVLAHLPTGQP